MTFHRRILYDDDDSPDNFACFDHVSPPLSQLLPLPPPPPPCPPPPPFGAPYHGHHHLLVLLFVGSSVVAAFLLLSIVYFAVLRRRRLRGAFFFPSAASDGAPPSDAGDVAPPAFDEAEAPLHHVWYIRTVGLDETTIEKIAVTEYKASDGLRAGDGDCSVCLGEFEDGDLVRLLPKCGHAFHVPCIDTWLRARINCPLCRAPVVDPDGAAAAVAAPPSLDSAGVPVVSGFSSSSNHDITRVAQTQAAEEQTRTEGQELVIDVGTAANTDEEASEGTSESPTESRALHGRSASMDSTLLGAVTVRLQPEAIVECSQEAKVHNSCGRHGIKAKDSVQRSLSTGGRSFFLYKHGRAAKNAASPSLPL